MKQVDNNSTNKNKRAKRRYEWNPKSKRIRVLTTMSCCSTNSIPEQYEQNFDIPWRRAATYRHSYIQDAGGNDSLHILLKLTCAICRTHTGNDGHHITMYVYVWPKMVETHDELSVICNPVCSYVRQWSCTLGQTYISYISFLSSHSYTRRMQMISIPSTHTLAPFTHANSSFSLSHTHASICVWTEMKNICINVS